MHCIPCETVWLASNFKVLQYSLRSGWTSRTQQAESECKRWLGSACYCSSLLGLNLALRPAGGGICDCVAVVGGMNLSHRSRRRTATVLVADRVRQVETAQWWENWQDYSDREDDLWIVGVAKERLSHKWVSVDG